MQLVTEIISSIGGSQPVGLVSLALCLFYMAKKDKHIERVVTTNEKIVNKLADSLDENTKTLGKVVLVSDWTGKHVKKVEKKVDEVIHVNQAMYAHMMKNVKHMKQNGIEPIQS